MVKNPNNAGAGFVVKSRIGVLGPGRKDPAANRLAERIGEGIARGGAILVCGGLGGAMEAAARGAKKAGGLVVGILPGESASAANKFVDIPIPTGMGNARNVINVLAAQVVIAIRGEAGTLSEIALALKTGRPVVGLDTWPLEREGKSAPDGFFAVQTPEEAVKKAFELIQSSEREKPLRAPEE